METDLPLLKKVDLTFKGVNLENTLIIACQHILETNFTMFNHLFKKGLKPKNTFLLGKCYSTNKEVLNKFRKKGVYVHKGSTIFDSHKSFDEQFEDSIKNLLGIVKKKVNFDNYDKTILIDDGGYLVYWANQILKKVKNVTAIEQTSSGYLKLKNEELNFPVINVARSKTKLKYESPFIAEVVVKKINDKIKELKFRPNKALIIGVGFIGKEIYKNLNSKLNIDLYDIKFFSSKLNIRNIGSNLEKYDLIIGATGQEIIGLDLYFRLKKNCVLVSASSSDREFASVNLRKLVKKTKNCHKDIYSRKIHLLNCGFPINFDGKEHSVSPKKIQLTRALMLAGIYLSKKIKYKNGLLDLNKDVQNQILREFQK